jgi:hypothetical protein
MNDRRETDNRRRVVSVPIDEVELHLQAGWAFADDHQIYGTTQQTHLLMVLPQPQENAA